MRTVTWPRGGARARTAVLACGAGLTLVVSGCTSAPSGATAAVTGSSVSASSVTGGQLTASPAPGSGAGAGTARGSGPAPITYLTAPPGPAGPSSVGGASEPTVTNTAASGIGGTGGTGTGDSGVTSSAPAPSSSNSSKASAPAASSFAGLDASLSTTYGTPVTLNFGLVSGARAVPGASTTVSHGDRTVTVHLDGRGRGSARLTGLPVGTTTVHVRYPGDATHRPAAATVTVSVTRRPTEIRSLTAAGNTLTVNQSVSVDVGDDVTVGFDVYSTGGPVTDGKATVSYDGTQKPVTLDGDGHASLTLAGLPAGRHQVVVRYLGDKTRDGAGAPFTIDVTDAAAGDGSGGGSPPNSDNPCPAIARACVDLSNSTTWLQSDGKIIYGPVPMSSGRPGYRTPSGTFQVYWKDKDHYSSLFDDAPMPNSVFFVGGVAFHEGDTSVESHGCIHLSWDASQTYWDDLQDGDTVYVFGYAPY